MLELQNVSSGYGRLPVLFDVSLTVAEGEMVSVLGANGAGKSTLLKTIQGTVTPSAGEITFQGQRITTAAAHQRVAAGLALSPEGRQVFSSLSVKENLVCGTYRMGSKEIKAQLDRVHELFPILRDRSAQRAGSLSGGEQQMLAIGRALMSKPKLVMVDELSLGLAPLIVENLYSALRDLCGHGLAVIMVEQFHHFAEGHSDRQLVVDKGRLIADEAADAAVVC